MRAFTNTDLIESRTKWAKRIAPLTMLFLVGGLITNFLSINQPDYFRPTLILLALGFTLSIFSSNLVNAWVREPRADQALTSTLKKFGNDFILFHHTAAVPHVLLTPNRLYAIVAKRQPGDISVRGDRISRKFSWMRVLRYFAEEGLGAPMLEAQNRAKKLTKSLSNQLEAEAMPEISPLVVFTNPGVELTVESPAVPVMRLNQLKTYLRDNDKQRAISAEQRNTLVSVLGNGHPEESSKKK